MFLDYRWALSKTLPRWIVKASHMNSFRYASISSTELLTKSIQFSRRPGKNRGPQRVRLVTSVWRYVHTQFILYQVIPYITIYFDKSPNSNHQNQRDSYYETWGSRVNNDAGLGGLQDWPWHQSPKPWTAVFCDECSKKTCHVRRMLTTKHGEISSSTHSHTRRPAMELWFGNSPHTKSLDFNGIGLGSTGFGAYGSAVAEWSTLVHASTQDVCVCVSLCVCLCVCARWVSVTVCLFVRICLLCASLCLSYFFVILSRSLSLCRAACTWYTVPACLVFLHTCMIKHKHMYMFVSCHSYR